MNINPDTKKEAAIVGLVIDSAKYARLSPEQQIEVSDIALMTLRETDRPDGAIMAARDAIAARHFLNMCAAIQCAIPVQAG